MPIEEENDGIRVVHEIKEEIYSAKLNVMDERLFELITTN
jgi:hypothetical protein